MKTLLILVDGMRPDALEECETAQNILKKSNFTLKGTTVMPSVTLPCHMSLFHSVEPARHGTTTNTYMPQVRPIRGLVDVLNDSGKSCAFFYNWEQLRDLSRPGALTFSYFCRGKNLGWEKTNDMVAKAAAEYLKENETDFAFVYLAYVDAAGHKSGWMSPEYTYAIENSWKNIAYLLEELGDEYTVLITADHGGHDRTHGSELPEDMTIPVIVAGDWFVPGDKFETASILDLAPTIVKMLGVAPDEEWEGSALYE